MAALDAYDWFVEALGKHSNPALRHLVKEQREYLLTLRSEDERQRYVDEALEELRLQKSDRSSAKS